MKTAIIRTDLHKPITADMPVKSLSKEIEKLEEEGYDIYYARISLF